MTAITSSNASTSTMCKPRLIAYYTASDGWLQSRDVDADETTIQTARLKTLSDS